MNADIWSRYEAVADGDRSAMTTPERAVFAICDLRQEVNSGGFDSYFRYRGGNTASEARKALPDVLGAKWSALLADALDDLDTRFYALEDASDVDARMTAYLDALAD